MGEGLSVKLIESEAGLVVPVMSAGVGEDEVTLTSWLHAAQRRKKTEKRRGG